MPKLLLKFNAAVIKEIPLGPETISVGRKPDNTVVIDNPAVSGHHCSISLQGGVYVIEDLESTNGTFVNEKRIKKSGLHHNDVVGIAKHALVFLEDAPPEAAGADKTVMITPEKQAELVAASAAAAKGDGKPAQVGILKILTGVVGPAEFQLTGMSTYIGKSDRVQIQIKGSGLFGGAPEVACSVLRKPDGYYLLAVQEGYPIVNKKSVTGSVMLKDGDFIECGATTMQFLLKDGPGAKA